MSSLAASLNGSPSVVVVGGGGGSVSSATTTSSSARGSLGDWRGMTSASRVYAVNGYEISDDLQRRKVEVLEKRYGGRARAHRAALVIQRAFREYRLSRRWIQMTQPQPLRRIPAGVQHDLPRGSPSTRSTRTPSSLLVSPHRYQPCTSLSAQLRADRATRACTEERSPPSPAPCSVQNRSMIESLMSPRLVQRRFPGGGGGGGGLGMTSSSGMMGGGAKGQEKNSSVPPVCVWVPRTSLANQNPAHSNSLPRLEKHLIRDRDDTTPVRLASRPYSEQDRKRQYRIALNFFNKKPERGVQLLISWGFVDDSAESMAKLLFGRRGLSKQMIGEYIGTLHSSYHSCVLKYFIALMDLRNLEVDVALRKAFQFFILPKESEKIDKVLQAFALHYCKCNPKRAALFRGNWDAVHILSFAIIMLNTDLHTAKIKDSSRMKRDDFVRNLRGQDKLSSDKQGADFDRSLLEGIYERVRLDAFLPGDDHVAQVRRVDMAIVGKEKPVLCETQRRLVCYCRLQQVLDPSKRQPSGSHERDVFLFNDMLVVAKVMSKRRSAASTTYTLKHHTPLLGASVQEFTRGQFEYGLTITCPGGNREKFHFNARNCEDRRRFVADVVESMRESQQMDEVRLSLEMDQLRTSAGGAGSGAGSSGTDSQRDSGLPDMEGQPPTRRLSFNSLDSGVVEETYEGH